MNRRAPSLAIAIIFLFLLASLSPVSGSPANGGAEAGVEFQNGLGNTKHRFVIGETAVFYIRDAGLATIATSTAAWTRLTQAVPAETWWSLATGAPDNTVFSLIGRTAYDTATPQQTPLASVPLASVNAVRVLVTGYKTQTGEFTLLNDVNADSALRVEFEFDVVDRYLESEHLARVASASDPNGEWVAIIEVASETDEAPSPTSGLFRGHVLLSGDAAAAEPGNGAVWVMPEDSLTVNYFDSEGSIELAAHQAVIARLPAVEVPGTGLHTLVIWAQRPKPSSGL